MTTCAIYVRISEDTEGRALGVDRQRQDCEALAAKRGYEVGQVYSDNDISASTLSKKRRPAYESMLSSAERGEVSVILAYSASRLTRRPREMEALVDLSERRGVRFETVVSGDIDLSTADGRLQARLLASIDAAEAERTKERVARQKLARASQGMANGSRRTYGWNRDGSLHPGESRHLLEVIDKIIHHTSLRQATIELNAAGQRTTMGNEWVPTTLKKLLSSPRLVGHVVYQGEVLRDGTGKPVQGSWTPLLDETTWTALQGALRRTERARSGTSGALLSGILVCGQCGGRKMYQTKVKGKLRYRCRGAESRSCWNSIGAWVDEAIGQLIVMRMARDEDLDVEIGPWPGAEELVDLEGRLREAMAAFKDGTLSSAVAFPMMNDLRAQIDELEKGRTRWESESIGPASSQVDVQLWEKGSLEDRRATVATYLEAVVIRPSEGRSGRGIHPERIEPIWRQWSGTQKVEVLEP